ncbi:hypothetical protein N9422_05380 [Candidatus Pelagibacter sp.]|nr:hypothetical protein [Candidatus Pelagibacter sp.]
MNIQIITKTFEYSNKNSIIFPFIAFKKKLIQKNIFFKILFNLNQVRQSDIIIIDSKYHRDFWINNENDIYEDFLNLKKNTNKLIYFDTTDSSGMIQSEIMDYVDHYWKFQILKDKSQYEKKFYGGRIFSDYYHKEFNINDQNILISKPINKNNIDKIKLAWNFGLADYSYKNKYLFFLRKKFLLDKLFSFSKKKNNIKNNFMFSAFNYEYSRQTISFQRKKIKDLIKDMYLGRISEYKYHFKLSRSRCVISPFGWGELAYRDFEAFYNRCILIKPNMEHILTWPNFFIKNETYLDFAWDFSNLLDLIEDIKFKKNEYDNIALNGFNTYHKYTSGEKAGDYFANHLNNLLDE